MGFFQKKYFRYLLYFSIIFLIFSANQKPAQAQSTFQPSAPYYATFFYLWSQNPNTDGLWSYWSDGGHTPPDNWFSQYLPDPKPGVFDPATELYSSSNVDIIYWQLRKLAEARQEVAIASWWGQGHKSDNAFRKIITDVMNRADNPYPNLRWAVYYEKEGFADVPLSEIVSDLNYIKNNYANQPGYFKVGGKPVVFVYNAAHTGYSPLGDLDRWSQARAQTGFYVNMKVDPLNAGGSASAVDSWHDYAPANRSGSKGTYYSFISPGFWLNGTAMRLARDPAAFETALKSMVASNATWKLTETWNEWGEGSSVEPAVEVNQVTSGKATIKSGALPFENTYVNYLAANLPPLEQGTGSGNPTPTKTPTPGTSTPTPTVIVPTSGADPVIAAVGDIACGADSTGAACKEWETSELARKINPAAVLVLGDNQYEQGQYAYYAGTDPYCNSNPPRCYNATWGRMKSITYPAVGNHEYLTPNAQGHFDYFNGIGNQTGRAGDRSKGYFSFNIGTWHLIALNTNCSAAGGCGASSPQNVWLQQELAANKNKCIIAYMHHPLYSSGHDGNNTTLLNNMRPLWQTLYNGKTDVVLVGHSHHYERFAPQDANSNRDDVNGFREFLVGTGGRNFTGYWTTNLANSEIKNNTTFGILQMTLRQNSYDWKFLPIPGQTFTDSGTGVCHANVIVSASPSPTPTTPATITPTISQTVCSRKAEGDADCNGLITTADFEMWRKENFKELSTTNADFNGDGVVGLVDFEIWRRGFFK